MKDAKKVTRVEKLRWLAVRPQYYPYILQKLRDAIRLGFKSPDSQKTESKVWFRDNAIDLDTAFRKYFKIDKHQPFETRYPAEIERGKKAIEDCPVKLPAPEPDFESMDLLYQLVEYLGAERVLETGVAYGWSTLALLLALRKRPNSRLISIDMPYLGIDNPSTYVAITVPQEMRSQWTLIARPDAIGLPSALQQLPTLDLACYDSDKTYEGRLRSYKLLWDALRSGGILFSDDITDNFGFRDFCQQIGQTPIVIKTTRRRIGLIIKP